MYVVIKYNDGQKDVAMQLKTNCEVEAKAIGKKIEKNKNVESVKVLGGKNG